MHEQLLEIYNSDANNIVEPKAHQEDTANVLLFSFALALAWMTQKVLNYEKANNRVRDGDKIRKAQDMMGFLFALAADACRQLPPESAPDMAIGGVAIAIAGDSFSLDLTPVIGAHPAIEQGWRWMFQTGEVFD